MVGKNVDLHVNTFDKRQVKFVVKIIHFSGICEFNSTDIRGSLY